MGYTQHRITPWQEVMGADGEKILAVGTSIGALQSMASPGGDVVMTIAAVPAGKLWVVSAGTSWDDTSAIAIAEIAVQHGGNRIILGRVVSPARWVVASIASYAILFPGDQLEGVYIGTTAGDTLYLTYIGYTMTIP